MSRGIYKGIVVDVYEYSGLRYHIEPVNVEDMKKCKGTRFVEYRGHWYTTVPKEDVEIIGY